jgi:hypothetical protein
VIGGQGAVTPPIARVIEEQSGSAGRDERGGHGGRARREAPHVADVERAGRPVEGEAPRVAESQGEDLVPAGIRPGERIVRRRRARAGGGGRGIDVDPEDLAEERRGVLGAPAGIEGAAAVAHADVEETHGDGFERQARRRGGLGGSAHRDQERGGDGQSPPSTPRPDPAARPARQRRAVAPASWRATRRA